MKLSSGNGQYALGLGAIAILACLCAPAAQGQPPKPKHGPLGMKFVPLPMDMARVSFLDRLVSA
jgi:hypothetical protein